MVSYFGEVVYPSSRAFWDEEEEESFNEASQNKVEFSVQWTDNKPTHIKKLLLVEGETITDFVKECLVNNVSSPKAVCVIENESCKAKSIFYRITEDLYLCLVSSKLDPKFTGEFVNTISDILKNTESVITIISLHVSKYKNTNVPNVPSFLRVLSTKYADNSLKFGIKPLEQPNMIFGVSAGVLSYAEVLERSAVLYAMYTDSFALDSLSAEPLIKLLSEILDCNIDNVRFAGKDFFNKGNLYM